MKNHSRPTSVLSQFSFFFFISVAQIVDRPFRQTFAHPSIPPSQSWSHTNLTSFFLSITRHTFPSTTRASINHHLREPVAGLLTKTVLLGTNGLRLSDSVSTDPGLVSRTPPPDSAIVSCWTRLDHTRLAWLPGSIFVPPAPPSNFVLSSTQPTLFPPFFFQPSLGQRDAFLSLSVGEN